MPSTPVTAAELLAAMPYAVSLGITFAEAEPSRVLATLAWSPDHCTTAGVQTDLVDSAGKNVGQTTQTQAVLTQAVLTPKA